MTESMEAAAETPLNDMLGDLAHELVEHKWRLKAEAPDGWASHSCGRALSEEVGRVINAYLAAPAPVAVEAGLVERLRSWAIDGQMRRSFAVQQICNEAASALSSLQEQVEAMTRERDGWKANCQVQLEETHRTQAEVTRLRQRVEEMDRSVDFVAVWAWREDPPNVNKKLTDSDRLSAIKWHPAIHSRTKEPNNV